MSNNKITTENDNSHLLNNKLKRDQEVNDEYTFQNKIKASIQIPSNFSKEDNTNNINFNETLDEEMSDEETEETKEESSDETSSDEDLDLDLNLDEVPEEEPEEEKKEESLNLSKEASENESDHKSENLTLNEEVEDTKVEVEANNIEKQLTETSVRAMRDTWTIEESSILKYYPNKHQVEDYINKAKAVESKMCGLR